MERNGEDTRGHGARLPGLPICSVGPEVREEARRFFGNVYAHRNGLGLLEGPGPLDKVSVVREFVRTLPPATPVAIVDGGAADEDRLSAALMDQFGFDGQKLSNTDRLSLLRYFVTHKAVAGTAPLVMVDNAHAMRPCACRLLDDIGRIRTKQGDGVIRLILASDRALVSDAGTAELKTLVARKTAGCKLRGTIVATARVAPRAVAIDPAASSKTAAVADAPATDNATRIEPVNEGDHTSGGLESTQDLPSCANADIGNDADLRQFAPTADLADVGAGEDKPVLVVAVDGRVVQQVVISKSKCTIGRSQQNDIPIRNAQVSRMHILIMWFDGMPLLVDLNSRNGVHVNAEKVDSRVLAHGDVITIGRHRILYCDTASRRRASADDKEATSNGRARMKRKLSLPRVARKSQTIAATAGC